MENKLLLKLLSILPQFLFKRIVNFLSNYHKNKNLHKIKEEDFKPRFEANSEIAQKIYGNYFNDLIPAYGISLEIGNSALEKFSISKFFRDRINWKF